MVLSRLCILVLSIGDGRMDIRREDSPQSDEDMDTLVTKLLQHDGFQRAMTMKTENSVDKVTIEFMALKQVNYRL